MDIRELFRRDLTAYQSIPFWSWNDELKEDRLREQIRDMKKAGIGGFFMHARGDLMTEYLGKDWMDATAACIDEAEKQGMDAWCYDENGWPSGFAGMKLLEDKENWEHYIVCKEVSAFDPEAYACYIVENNKMRRVTEGKAQYAVYDMLNSSVVDILNKDIVQKFIRETHEEYYAHFGDKFGKAMKGFFTDEPQYFRYDTAFTPCILPLYKERYGEDLLDTLAALFIECEQSDTTRYRYWLLMNELYTESFAGTIYAWCEAHNCQLTGHSIEERNLFGQMMCCAGIMPFYEYEHKPGMDWLGRGIDTEIAPKQVASVAQQLGKKHTLTETFACAGWDVTPRELKRIAEWQYVNGINQMCQHLYPYSIRGQRKRDYPAFYSEHNPWTKEFRRFNDYFTTLGVLLADSKENAKVCVIHPIHSAYFTFKRNEHVSIKQLDTDFAALCEKLGAHQINHHYADESLLAKYGSVKDGKFIVGLCEYDKVVIPKMQGLDGTTLTLLREFVAQGGKLYLDGKCPTHVDGIKQEVGLSSNIAFSDLEDDAISATPSDTDIRSTFRTGEFGDLLYAVNLSETDTQSITYSVKALGACAFDLETREKKPLCFERTQQGISLPLVLAAGESIAVLFGDYAPAKKQPMRDERIVPIHGAQILSADDNTLTLDYAALSYDGTTYTKPMPVMAISDRLLREKTNREVFLKYRFTVREKPASLRLEWEKACAKKVLLNGKEILATKKGDFDPQFVAGDVLDNVKLGENEIVLAVDYFQPELVYRVFNGVYYDHSGDTETMINCLSYVTDIEAVYLRGDFGVASDAEYADDAKNTLVTKGAFSVTKAKKDVDLGELTREGYPFFGGEMTVRTNIQMEGDEKTMRLIGRFGVAKVSINGSEPRVAMLSDTVDIAGLAKKGDNAAEITLLSSYRNVFGPFHHPDPDPFGVGPDTFSRYGTWKDGESEKWLHRYSFTRFGIEKVALS
ncbi:MAG: glycosyl hydrolase [Christensenellales bacterium]|jgi:hypothetical protein